MEEGAPRQRIRKLATEEASLEAWNSSEPIASKETGPWSYNCKELNSVSSLDEQGTRSSPRASKKVCSPVDTLLFSLERPGLDYRCTGLEDCALFQATKLGAICCVAVEHKYN